MGITVDVNVGFSTPLHIILGREQASPRGIFTVQINDSSYTHKGENMSEVLGVGHYATVTVEWVDSLGNPAKVDGPTKWESTDPAVLSVTVSTGNPLIANCKALKIGNATIMATADADMGEGVQAITSSIDVQVIAGQAVGGSMTFEDMGSGPPAK